MPYRPHKAAYSRFFPSIRPLPNQPPDPEKPKKGAGLTRAETRLWLSERSPGDLTAIYVDASSRSIGINISGGRLVSIRISKRRRDTNEIELAAILGGLEAAKLEGLGRVVIHTDSLVALGRIRKALSGPTQWPLADRIIRRSDSFYAVMVRWIPREENRTADRLASWSNRLT